MHAYANSSRQRVWLVVVTGLWLGISTPAAQAEPNRAETGKLSVQGGAVRLMDEVYVLDAEVDYQFSAPVLEALENGVPLVVELQIEVTRHRTWLWNEQQTRLAQRYQLSYHALTEQYLVKNLNSAVQQNLPSAEAAIDVLGQVTNLPLLDKRLLDADENYTVRLRAQLNLDALPTPLRLPAYLSPQWRLTSEWYTWPLQP